MPGVQVAPASSVKIITRKKYNLAKEANISLFLSYTPTEFNSERKFLKCDNYRDFIEASRGSGGLLYFKNNVSQQNLVQTEQTKVLSFWFKRNKGETPFRFNIIIMLKLAW